MHGGGRDTNTIKLCLQSPYLSLSLPPPNPLGSVLEVVGMLHAAYSRDKLSTSLCVYA